MNLCNKEILEESIYTVLDKLMTTKREQTPSKKFFDRIYEWKRY